MWKFSKGKDAPEKIEPDNITDSSDTENPDVEEAPSSVEDNVIGKKKFNTKNIVILMTAVIAVLVISLVIFVCLYLNNQNGHDNSGSSIVSNSESTASTSSVDSSLSEDGYVGYWHIQSVGEIELVINSIFDGKVNFTYRNWFFEPMEIEAELDGTVASFSYNQDGISFNGFLTFNPASVVMDITESNHEYIPVTTYSFNERSQRSWFQSDNYDTSVPDVPESGYQSEAYPYNPYEEYPYYYEEYPYDTESAEEYTEPSQSIPEPEPEQETSSQESHVSSNTGSSQRPEPSGVQLDSNIYGLGELHTKNVNGIVFKWYDRYERWEPRAESNPSIDIISLNPVYELFYGRERYAVNFEVEVSKNCRAVLSWKAYDGDGYFINNYSQMTASPILEKFKDDSSLYSLVADQQVYGTKEMILIPSLSRSGY